MRAVPITLELLAQSYAVKRPGGWSPADLSSKLPRDARPMSKAFDHFHIVRQATAEQIDRWSEERIRLIRDTAHDEARLVEAYVAQIRRLNPAMDHHSLAHRIMRRRSLKAGCLGAVCGLGGFITFPVTMPASLDHTFRIQARMVLSIGHIYGWDITDDDVITDMLLLIGGSSGLQAAKSVGIQVGQEFAKKAVQNCINREMLKKINKVVSRKIITKAGQKSFTSFTKLIPLVGAPIGGGFDYFGTRGIGRAAIAFYST